MTRDKSLQAVVSLGPEVTLRKGKNLLPATVCFSIGHALPRDAHVKTSNDIISVNLDKVSRNSRNYFLKQKSSNRRVQRT